MESKVVNVFTPMVIVHPILAEMVPVFCPSIIFRTLSFTFKVVAIWPINYMITLLVIKRFPGFWPKVILWNMCYIIKEIYYKVYKVPILNIFSLDESGNCRYSDNMLKYKNTRFFGASGWALSSRINIKCGIFHLKYLNSNTGHYIMCSSPIVTWQAKLHFFIPLVS